MSIYQNVFPIQNNRVIGGMLGDFILENYLVDFC